MCEYVRKCGERTSRGTLKIKQSLLLKLRANLIHYFEGILWMRIKGTSNIPLLLLLMIPKQKPRVTEYCSSPSWHTVSLRLQHPVRAGTPPPPFWPRSVSAAWNRQQLPFLPTNRVPGPCPGLVSQAWSPHLFRKREFSISWRVSEGRLFQNYLWCLLTMEILVPAMVFLNHNLLGSYVH